jgi:DNA polymerase-3 subunit epsilon
MTWHNGRMAVFDLKTTSADPEQARIVTACVGYVAGGADTNIRQWVIDPGIEIPDEATKIHGITTAYVREHGGRPVRAVAEIATALRQAWDAGHPVVAFNGTCGGTYGLTVLDREMRRHGLGDGFQVRGSVVDPFVIDREVDKYRRGKRTLSALCEHYGISLTTAHDAGADAVATAHVAWAIASVFPRVAAMSLRELHEAQAGWHRARQEDFAVFLRRTGKDGSGVCAAWPQRPYTGPTGPVTS